MLSLEYLLEESKSAGLPIQKPRAILREYLQVIILNVLYKSPLGERFFFMGGTAMRFFHRLPRFSEDLDFNASSLTQRQFEQAVKEVIQPALQREGFSVITNLQTRKTLFQADLQFKEVMKTYGIVDKRGLGMMIKIEVNRPSWKLTTESKVFTLYGYPVSAILMDRGDLFAEKLCALFARKRGRDIYDTVFMLHHQFPINENVLRANKILLPIKKTLLDYLGAFQPSELKRLADQVRPFLFREDQAEWVLKAPLYVETLLK